MKNIFRIIALTVLPLLMVSCQEKFEPYQPADMPSGPQVYFSANNSQSFTLAGDGTSFNIVMGRANTSDALTVGITASGDGVQYFSVPSSVTFSPGQALANLTVGYSLETLGYDNAQSIKLEIADKSLTSEYGATSFSCTAQIPSPWTLLGKAKVAENWWFEGSFSCNIYQNDLDPNLFRMDNPFGGTGDDAKSEFRILKVGDTYKGVAITEPDLVGYDDIYVAYHSTYDADIYALHPGRLTSTAALDNFKFQKVVAYQENGLPGLISLSPFYYMFGVGGWNKTTVGDLIVITMPGYAPKDYSISNTYDGVFSNAETGADEIVTTVTAGPDVDEIILAVAPGLDAEGIVFDVLTGAIEGMSVYEDGQWTVPMPEDAANGEYTLVAISCGEGEAQEFSYVSFAYCANAAEDNLKEGLYEMASNRFTVEKVEPYRYVVTNLGIKNNTEFWAAYDPTHNTLTLSGYEIGYEDQGSQFAVLYDYFDKSVPSVYVYASYASEESEGDDPLVFAVDPESHELTSIMTDFAIEVYEYAAGYPFLFNYFEAEAGTDVVLVPEDEEESETKAFATSFANNGLRERVYTPYAPTIPGMITTGHGMVGISKYHNDKVDNSALLR